jgi:hypothetical protein
MIPERVTCRTCAPAQAPKDAKGKSSSGPRGICLVKRSEVLGLNDFNKDHRESVFRDELPEPAWPAAR